MSGHDLFGPEHNDAILEVLEDCFPDVLKEILLTLYKDNHPPREIPTSQKWNKLDEFATELLIRDKNWKIPTIKYYRELFGSDGRLASLAEAKNEVERYLEPKMHRILAGIQSTKENNTP